MEKIADMWLTLLLKSRIKKMDFRIETVPSVENPAFECCGPSAICIVAEYKWFWEKSTPSECCDK